MRIRISEPATIAAMAFAPLAWVSSATASAVGTTIAEVCMIDGRWVASKSLPCMAILFNCAAPSATYARDWPITVQRPSFTVRSTTFACKRTKAFARFASATPIESSRKSAVFSRTSAGMRSLVHSRAKSVSCSM